MYNIVLLLLILICEIKANITDTQYASIPELFYQDNYDRCMLLEDKAFYCSITYILEPIDKDNSPEIWNIIRNISRIETNYRHDHLRHGICVPTTCPEVQKNDPFLRKAIENCYNEKFRHLQLQGTVSKIECQTPIPKYPVDWLDILSGILFVAYLLLVLYGTFYEGIARYKTPEEYQQLTSTKRGKILSSFSLTKNWIRLKTINMTPEMEKLRCIQGIRFEEKSSRYSQSKQILRVYNTSLVILSHVLLSSISTPVANTRYQETLYQKFVIVFFSSGPLCVGTFFFMSSFLLSNGLFKYMEDKKGLSVKMCFFAFCNRLLRLTPTMGVVILFQATWFRHLGNGPYWNHFTLMEFKNCRANWWANLLYIQNWVNNQKMCMPTTWYLALDTQYFAISLLFIWLMKIYENYVWVLIGAALSFNVIGTFWQNYYYDFTALTLPTPEFYYGLENMLSGKLFLYQLGGFIGNMAGPIVGIGFGYYLHKHKKAVFTTKFKVFIWWISTFVFGLSFVIITGLIILRDDVEHDALWASAYVAISRPLSAFVIGIFIIGCTEGIGWLALRVVQWPPTYILGRLTFSAYLVHLCVSATTTSLARYPQYVSDYTITTKFLGDTVTIYMAATFLTLFFELPGTALQKLIFQSGEVQVDENNKKVDKTM